MSETSTHFRSCPLCEAICGLEIQVRDQQVLSIKGDKADPLSRGHICPKAIGLKDIHEDPNRLKFPLKKTADGWKQIDWETAFDEVANRLKAIQSEFGKNAVGMYNGNPSVHNYGTLLFNRRFIKSLQTKNAFSATSVDQLPHQLAAMFMFGNDFVIPIPDVDHTDCWVIMGANPMASNGSLMTVPDVGKRIRAIRERGGKVVVIDPRFTETAAKASQHIFIRPGTDTWLLLAIIHTLFEKNLLRTDHLKDLLIPEEVDHLKEVSAPFTIALAAQKTGIPAAIILQLIHDITTADRACCYGRMGLSTVAFGGLNNWLINCINILTGNFDRPGGAMFTKPAFDTLRSGPGKMRFNRWQSRVRGLPEFGGELPSATLAEEILTPGEGQIKALVTSCGNPVLSTPNGRQLDQALEQLDFMVSIDIYLNETTRHADIILPPATGLEVGHYDISFLQLAVRNVSKFSPPVLEKAPGTKFDWEIFLALEQRMKGSSADEVVPSPEQMLEFGLQHGPYDVSLQKLKDQPSGIDLGPLQPVFRERMRTAHQKINLIPDLFLNDLQRLQKPSASTTTPLLLIGRRDLRSNNSWMHNSYRLVKGRNRCTLLMHPEDAAKRKLSDGAEVKIRSRVGEISIPLEITDQIMPGVVSIPHGWGHDREGIQLDIAQAHAGVSMNDLTDHLQVDELTGNAVVNGVEVEVGT